MTSENFFGEVREQSAIKTSIVEHYFYAWSKIIMNTQDRYRGTENRVGYIDLFAGPGKYKSGKMSTPLRILTRAIDDKNLRERLVTIFNDKSKEHCSSLKDAINKLEGISKLKHKPSVFDAEVDDALAEIFEDVKLPPSLAFIDPWGYKGLSLRLVDALIKDWGCDCIFFFNYARINAGLSNPTVKKHMTALFSSRSESLSAELKQLDPKERESVIIEALAEELGSLSNKLVLPFSFMNDSGSRTSHHIIFVTKEFKGYEVMKDIMARQSSSIEQGVANFQYCPANNNKQGLLFELNRPLDDLESMLLNQYAGKTLKFDQVYKEHSVGKPYTKKNYKDVLKGMENKKTIHTYGRKSNRGFADDLRIGFPRAET